MFQDAQGQWYDDNYNQIADPTQYNSPPPSGFGPPQPFVNTAPGANSNPAGPGPVVANPGTPWALTQQQLEEMQRQGGVAEGSPNWKLLHPDPPAPPPSGNTTGSPSSGGSFWPGYTPQSPYQFTPYSGFTPFSYDSYSPLTADQAAQEPGYAFANQQGRDAIQTSQASKGNVLSGAALKDLFAWGDQFAGQNYQGAEARNENVYNMNRNNAFNNWAGNETGKYQQWAGNQQYGLPAWVANNQPGQFGANLAQQQAGLTLADLFNRFNTSVDANTKIATAGAN